MLVVVILLKPLEQRFCLLKAIVKLKRKRNSKKLKLLLEKCYPINSQVGHKLVMNGCMKKFMVLIFPHCLRLWKRVLFNPLSTLFSDYPIIKSTVPVLEEHGKKITTRFYQLMFGNHPELLNIFNHANQREGR